MRMVWQVTAQCSSMHRRLCALAAKPSDCWQGITDGWAPLYTVPWLSAWCPETDVTWCELYYAWDRPKLYWDLPTWACPGGYTIQRCCLEGRDSMLMFTVNKGFATWSQCAPCRPCRTTVTASGCKPWSAFGGARLV